MPGAACSSASPAVPVRSRWSGWSRSSAAAGAGLELVRGLLALSQGVPVGVGSSLGRVVATATVGLVLVPVVGRLEHAAERRRFA